MDIIPQLFILITAVVFTGLGFYIGQQNAVSDIAEAIIDSLIEDGYIRTRGKGENLTLLKHWEK